MHIRNRTKTLRDNVGEKEGFSFSIPRNVCVVICVKLTYSIGRIDNEAGLWGKALRLSFFIRTKTLT